MEIIKAVNGIFWGWLIAGLLLSCGIFYTIRLGVPQVRYFTQLVPNLWKASRDATGVSAFGALCSGVVLSLIWPPSGPCGPRGPSRVVPARSFGCG